MSLRFTAAPLFPSEVPEEYSPAYFREVIRAFSLFAQQVANPGEGRVTKIVITNMPQDTDADIEPGTLYAVNGQVYISLLNRALVIGSSVTASAGTVDVVTT